MLINERNEMNITDLVDTKLTRSIDYKDTLEFKVPFEVDVRLDDIIIVKSKLINQKYRVHKIDVKGKFKDVFCKHIFFDCEKVVIPNLPKTSGVTLEYLASHINSYFRSNGYNFKVDSTIQRVGTVDVDNTIFYNLIFGDKGILDVYDCKVVWDNWKIKFVPNIVGKNTEVLFHENKNIVDMQNSVDSKPVVTKLYVKAKFKKDSSEESKLEQARIRRAKFLEKDAEIVRRQQAEHNRIVARQEEEERNYLANLNKPKRTRDEIHSEKLRKQAEANSNRLLKISSNQEERLRKFEEREREREARRASKETESVYRTIVSSPIINDYSRVYEDSIYFESSDILSQEDLEEYCVNNFFTEDDTRDVPISNFSFKPTDDNYNINIYDIAKVVYNSVGVNKNVRCSKLEYDAYNEKYISVEFGDLKINPRAEQLSNVTNSINNRISTESNNIRTDYDVSIEMIEELVAKELIATDIMIGDRIDEFTENLDNSIKEYEIQAIERAGDLAKEIDDKISNHKSVVESITNDFKGRLNTAESGLRELKTGVEAIPEKTKLMIVDEISKINLDDAIINNSTFVNLDNRISELSTNFNSKFDSNGNLISFRDFVATYNNSNSEINSKLEVLERYKNEDGSRRDNILSLAERRTGELINTSLTDIRSKFDTSGKLIELKTFENSYSANAREINSKLSSIQTFIDGEGARNDNIINLIESKTSDSISRELNSITNNFITKNVYTEKVDSIEHRLSQVSLRNENLVPYSEGFWRPFEFNEQIYYFMWVSKIHVNCVPDEVFTISSQADVVFTIKYINNLGDETGETVVFERTDNNQSLTFTIPEGIFRFYLTVHKADGSNISSTEIVNIMKTTKIENSNIATPFTVCSLDRQADSIVMVSSFNYFKQTLDQRLASISGVASNGQRLASEIDQRLTGITAKVSTLENNTLKYADIDISNNAIKLGVGNVINGTTLASLISVSPTAINMITDKVVITKNNENLVNDIFKNKCLTLTNANTPVTAELNYPLEKGDEFVITGEFRSLNNVTGKNLKVFLTLEYEGNYVYQLEFITILPSHVTFKNKQSIVYKIKNAPPNNRVLKNFKFVLAPDNHSWEVCNLSIIQKKSAELIVDGSITTKHLATNSITAGLIASGAIETKHLTTNSVVASALKVDQALIDKLLVNDLLVNSITAKSAFINKIKTIELDASKITSGYISADRIRGGTITGTIIGADVKIKLGTHGFMQPINDGLQICAPHGIYNFGVGFQFNGRSKTVMIRGVDYNVPKGLYIYNDDDFSSGDPIPTLPFTEIPLLTVESPIKASTRNGFKGFCVVSNPNRNGVNQEYAVEYLQMSKYNSGHYLLVEGSGTGVQLNGIAYSDKKLKENIQPSNVIALDYVKRFNFKEFNWKDGGLFERLGLVAQDLQLIDRDLVRESLLDKNLYLNTTYLLNLSLKAIQELNAKFDNNILKVGLLMAEREEYIATIENLERRIEILENKENVA